MPHVPETTFKGGLRIGRNTDDATNLDAIQRMWVQRSSVDFPSIAADSTGTQTVSVSGVVNSNTNAVLVTVNGDIADQLAVESADVTSDDTVTIRVLNEGGTATDASAVDVTVVVFEL